MQALLPHRGLFHFQKPRSREMPFQPGQSGNPAGRPRGARNRTAVIIEEALAENAQAIARKLIEQAQSGNGTAMALLAKSLLPQRKGAPIRIDLPELEDAADAPTAMAAIYASVCAGELTVAEGNAFIRMVEAFLRAKQTTGSGERRPERQRTPEVAVVHSPAPAVPQESEPGIAARERSQARADRVILSACGEPEIPNPRPVGMDPGARPCMTSTGMTALRTENSGQSLRRLRQEALASASPLAPSTDRPLGIVSHCKPVDRPAAPAAGDRAAA
jgi:hypothetical protein